MTLLRLLAGLFGGITVVYAEHIGDVHQHLDVVEPDDDCDCEGHDGPIALVLPEPAFYEQLVEAGMRARNGDDPHDVAREAIADLRLAEAAHDADTDGDEL